MVSFLDRREYLSNVDAAWLRMEDPTNLMMITGLMFFGEPLDFERVKATVVSRVLQFKRFRQRVRPPLESAERRRPYWETDPHFDLSYHLDRITLPPDSDEAMLQGVVSTMMSTPLDYDRPLWQTHLIENYQGGCVLLTRMHHCIADGIALMQVLLSMTDDDPDAPWPEVDEGGGSFANPLTFLFKPAISAVKKTTHVTRKLVHEGVNVFAHPTRVVDLARFSARGAKAALRLITRAPDPTTIYKGELGVPKRAAWSKALSLAEIKEIGRAVDGTVNDVLLAAMTGALRRYLIERNQPVEGLNFRAFVPVNLRRDERELRMGNRFGLILLSLPVGLVDPIERVLEFKRRIDAIKDTPEATVAFGLLGVIGMTPNDIQNVIVDIFGTKSTCVMTNVPGPQEPRYFAGEELKSTMFWVPQAARLGVGISLISYNGQVRMGVATDVGLVPDPETIIHSFHREFDDLLAMVRQAEVHSQPAGRADRNGTASETIQAAHCQALTKAGRPCKNRPRRGSRYCHVHQPEVESAF